MRAVEALVQVELHDLVLRIGLAQLVRERDLPDLPDVSLVRRKKLLFGELLRDRASAGNNVARAKVAESRPDEALDVEAGVAVEALVLDSDGGEDHGLRDVLQLHRQAVVAMVADDGQEAAVAVRDQGIAREGGAVEALDRWKAVEERLGVGVDGETDDQHDGQKDSQAAHEGDATKPLPDRRPACVDPRPRAMAPLGFDLLRNVSSHGGGARRFYGFPLHPTRGRGPGLRSRLAQVAGPGQARQVAASAAGAKESTST